MTTDLAQLRYTNALALFDEFVQSTVKHPDAATLRGLERRFAERVEIQPSYWSQIKARSRQIGERLARQFEQRCHKPAGWLDREHGAANATGNPTRPEAQPLLPVDEDERFIVGLVLTYYRRHPQRARTRLLDLLGEVLTPSAEGSSVALPPMPGAPRAPAAAAPALATRQHSADEAHELWLRSQSGVAPLKRKR